MLQIGSLVVLVVLNADLLFSQQPKAESTGDSVKKEHFNGPLMLVLIALSTVTTLFLYTKAAIADPGYVQTQVFQHQETELGDEIEAKHARKPSTVLEELDGTNRQLKGGGTAPNLKWI